MKSDKPKAAEVDRIRRWRERPILMVRELFGAEPDPWQAEVLEVFPNNWSGQGGGQRIAMPASKGPGKFLAKSITYDIPDGQKLWGDTDVGDKIFAEDGSVTVVTGVYEQGIQPVYRVTFSDGSSTLAGGEHLWKVQTAYDRKMGDRWRVMSTEDMLCRARIKGAGGEIGLKLESGQNRYSIPVQGAVQYARQAQPLDAYAVGLWLGDGVSNEATLVCPNDGIRAALTERGIDWRPRRRGDDGDIWFDGINQLKMIGVRHLRSHEKYIPERYKRGSIEQRLDLLRGLMDSDGTCTERDRCYLASSSRRLAEDFIWLARSLGYCAWLCGPYPVEGYRDSHHAVISGPLCPFLADGQKRSRWRPPQKDKYTRYIDAIEPEGTADCMCISVAHPSSCYLANDFIVTHNTCLEAWCAWNFLLTRPMPRVAAVSITGDNLRDGLWSEMAKWQAKSLLLQQLFLWGKERIVSRRYPETWWMAARSWSQNADAQQQADALAGIHEDYALFILDESGGIPRSVMAAAEGALATGKECKILQGGNTLRREGPLYDACTSERKLWHIVRINGDPDDPKRSPRVDAQWARDQILKYGRDNPWVLVNVFGQFPPSSLNTLIGPDEMAAAEKRSYREHDIAYSARVLGVDVAREGDDQSVMFPRQGLVLFAPTEWRNIDSIQGAGHVGRKIQDWGADATFVDNTGGFGAGWIDNLRLLGHAPIAVHYSGEPNDRRYYNKRAEMYFEFVDWIKQGGQVPACPELVQALTQITYTFKGDRFLLEDKKQLKERLGFSPDHADAAAQTFAQKVGPRAAEVRRSQRGRYQSEYHPYRIKEGEILR